MIVSFALFTFHFSFHLFLFYFEKQTMSLPFMECILGVIWQPMLKIIKMKMKKSNEHPKKVKCGENAKNYFFCQLND